MVRCFKRTVSGDLNLQSLSKPTLFHGTPIRVKGDALVPRRQLTYANEHARNTPLERELAEPVVFATPNIADAFAYAFKIHDSEQGTPFMARCGPCVLPGGVTAPIAILVEKQRFLGAPAQPTVFRMPASNSFIRVFSKFGAPMEEWISHQPVPIKSCAVIYVQTPEDAMRQGVQFFFFRGSSEEWRECYEPLCRRAEADGRYLSFLCSLLGRSLVEHFNVTRSIRPVAIGALS